MWQRHILQLLEGEPVQLVGNIEDTLPNILQFKVRRKLRLIYAEAFALCFGCVISPIPGLRGKFAALLSYHSLYICKFALGNLKRRSPYLVQKVINRLWSLCHTVAKDKIRATLITKNLCLLKPQLNKPLYNLLVVILIIVVAPVKVCGKHLLPILSICRVLQERHYAWVVQTKEPSLLAGRLCSCRRLLYLTLCKSLKAALLSNVQRICGCLCQEVLAKL